MTNNQEAVSDTMTNNVNQGSMIDFDVYNNKLNSTIEDFDCRKTYQETPLKTLHD